jgi:uncharacterized membrane protein
MTLMTDYTRAPEQRMEFEEQPDQHGGNVGRTERLISIAGGATIALFGLRQRSLAGLAIAGAGAMMVRRGVNGHCELYDALGIDTATGQMADESDYASSGIHVAQSYLINKPAQELYDFWRDFTNLPSIMSHLQQVCVDEDDGQHSTWVATAPGIAGGSVQWDAEITRDEAGKVIAWRSLPGADVDNRGEIRFEETQDRGTRVTVTLDYIPPAGTLGKWIARLFGEEPQQQIKEDLRNFKRFMEAGEIPTVNGQPRGTCLGKGKRDRSTD